MRKIKTVKLSLTPSDLEDGVNTSGMLGEKCNNCGGYGYTMKLGGGRLPCANCKESGVREMNKEELQKEVYDLKQDMARLRQALREDLGFRSVTVPHAVGEANHHE